MHRVSIGSALAGVAVIAGLSCAPSAQAVALEDMKGFESLFGHYGPKGDCSKYPQVVIDAKGFALERAKGQVERAPTTEFASSFFGPEYDGDARAFFPYWTDAGPNPLLVMVNDSAKGSLEVSGHDFGGKGTPPMPARYQPWLAGSPYAKCGK